jgi:hypothetical protein
MIKREADTLLRKYKLVDYLSNYGEVFIQGSYYLDLMTWRDLDIDLAVDKFDLNRHFAIGTHLATILNAYKMSFRNELILKTDHLPTGYYWGLYFNYLNDWKIDLWTVSHDDLLKSRRFLDDLKSQITPSYAESIRVIKLEAARRKNYRKEFSSTDIYKSVLEKNVRNVGEFKEYLSRIGKEY